MKNIFEWLEDKANTIFRANTLFLELKSKLQGSPSKTTKSTPQKEPYVFITTKGKKFHYDPCCSGLRDAKTYKMDLSKARKAGFDACSKCCHEYLHE